MKRMRENRNMAISKESAKVIVVSEGNLVNSFIRHLQEEFEISPEITFGVYRHQFYELVSKVGSESNRSFLVVFPWSIEQIILFKRQHDANSWHKILETAAESSGRSDEGYPRVAIVFSHLQQHHQTLYHEKVASRFWESGHQLELKEYADERRLFSLEEDTFSRAQLMRLEELFGVSMRKGFFVSVRRGVRDFHYLHKAMAWLCSTRIYYAAVYVWSFVGPFFIKQTKEY